MIKPSVYCLLKLSDLVVNRPYTPGVLEWKARISIRSLDPIDGTSTTAPPLQLPKLQDMQDAPPKPTLALQLCYACHTHLTSRTPRPRESAKGLNLSTVVLPMWTSASLANTAASKGQNGSNENESRGGGDEVWRTQKMDREEMRGAVEAFLLDDASAE